MKRIAFARIAQETNALSPVATTLHDFESAPLPRGRRAAARRRPTAPRSRASSSAPSSPGSCARASARTRSSRCRCCRRGRRRAARCRTDCFEALEARLVEGLRAAGPLDGMYLCLHGAMGVRGIADPETRLIRAARARGRRRTARRVARPARQPHARARRGGGRDRRATRRTRTAITRGSARRPARSLIGTRARRDRADDGVALAADDPRRRQDDRLPGADARGVPPHARGREARRSARGVDVHGPSVERRPGARLVDRRGHRTTTRRAPSGSPTSSPRCAGSAATSSRPTFPSRERGDRGGARARGAPQARLRDDGRRVRRRHRRRARRLDAPAARADRGGQRACSRTRAVRDPQAIATLWPRAPATSSRSTIGGTLDPARSPPLPVRGTIVSKHERHGFGRTVVLAVEHVRDRDHRGPVDGDAAVVLHRGRARSVAAPTS